MDMQDKDLDQLFRSKLEELETDPSGAVWQGIDKSLGDNRRKKIIPFLSIAASIIVLIAAGILFIPKNENMVKLRGKYRAILVKPSKVIAPAVTKQPVTIVSITTVIPTSQPVHLYHKLNNNTHTATAPQHITAYNNAPAAVNHQQVLAAISLSKTEVKQIAVIDSSTTIAAINPPVQHVVALAAVPGKQTTALPPAQKIADMPPVKKHGIHGLGDILNVVVAVVDKRKDKIIEFADSDGDGASITAVNLGPIKVKKDN